MTTILRIALRNISRQKKRTVLLAGAIAFGIMVITLLNGFTAGLVGNIKDNITYAFGGHLFISGAELTDSGRSVSRIGDDAVVSQVLAEVAPMVKSVHKRSRSFGSVVFGSKQTSQSIDGVDFQAERDLSKGLKVLDGSLDGLSNPRALVLPHPAAEKLGVEPGENVLIRLSTVTGQQNVGEFQVVAIIEDQGKFGFSTAYANLGYLNSLLGLEHTEYQMLSVFLTDMAAIDPVTDQIYDGLGAAGAELKPRPKQQSLMDMHEEGAEEMGGGMFGNLTAAETEPWDGTRFSMMTLNDMMQPVEYLITALNTVGLVIFLILLGITMVGIMNTFRMILVERTREIGTMRAFGMQRRGVRNIFLFEATLISVVGGVAGIALAGIIMAIASRISLAHIASLQFFLNNGHLSFVIAPGNLATNLLILVVLSLLAAYLPARAAAKLQPAKALGTHF